MHYDMMEQTVPWKCFDSRCDGRLLTRIFNRIDVDNSGQLSLAQLVDAARRVVGWWGKSGAGKISQNMGKFES